MTLTTTVERRRLTLDGELDAATAPDLLRALASVEGRIDAIDLSGLVFVDSAGVSALRTARRRYPKLALCRPSGALEQLVTLLGVREEILGLDRDLAVRRERSAADGAAALTPAP